MIGFCSSQGVTDAEGNILSELFPTTRKSALKSSRKAATTIPAPCASCAAR